MDADVEATISAGFRSSTLAGFQLADIRLDAKHVRYYCGADTN